MIEDGKSVFIPYLCIFNAKTRNTCILSSNRVINLSIHFACAQSAFYVCLILDIEISCEIHFFDRNFWFDRFPTFWVDARKDFSKENQKPGTSVSTNFSLFTKNFLCRFYSRFLRNFYQPLWLKPKLSFKQHTHHFLPRNAWKLDSSSNRRFNNRSSCRGFGNICGTCTKVLLIYICISMTMSINLMTSM